MSWFQKTLHLPPSSRGSYLVTDTIVGQLPEISKIKVGLCTLFIQHTSCALSLNENWDSDVRLDMSDALDRIVPYADVGGRQKAGKLGQEKEERWTYRHDAEGDDDMPAHVKSALIGATVTVPITNGKLALGTWQGTFVLKMEWG